MEGTSLYHLRSVGAQQRRCKLNFIWQLCQILLGALILNFKHRQGSVQNIRRALKKNLLLIVLIFLMCYV